MDKTIKLFIYLFYCIIRGRMRIMLVKCVGITDYYRLSDAQSCSTMDLDPLDSCNPVNCDMKYSGTRSYFNSRLKICERVPICGADETKGLPNVVSRKLSPVAAETISTV